MSIFDKAEQLQKSTEEKVNHLTGYDLQNKFESIKDKALLNTSYGPYEEVDGELLPFVGKTRNVYEDANVLGEKKIGLATSSGGFDRRYSGKNAPGPLGVTTKDGADVELTAPYDDATQFEYDVHSNKGMLEKRAAGLGNVDPNVKAKYGAGYTEYYTPDAPIYDPTTKESGLPLPEGTYVPDAPTKYNYEGYNRAEANQLFQRIAAEEGSTHVKQVTGIEDDIENIAKAIPAGVLEAAAIVSESPQKLYEALGGDYLEAGSAFAKENPNYTAVVNSIKDTMARGAEFIRDFKTDTLGYDDVNLKNFQQDIGEAFEEGNYVTGLVGAVVDNPTGAIELGANMWGISRAMASKGITGMPVILGVFSDNAAEAQEIYKKEYGRDAEGKDLALLLGAAAAGTAMDTIAAKVIFDKTGGSASALVLGRMVGSLINKVPSKVLQKALGGATSVSKFMGVEAFQEGFTEAAIVAGGTQDFDKFLSEEHKKRIYEAAASGAIAGPGMKVTDIVTGSASALSSKEAREAVASRIKAEVDRRKKAKEGGAPVSEEVRTKVAEPLDTSNPDTIVSKVADIETDIEGTNDTEVQNAVNIRKAEAIDSILSMAEDETTFGSSEKAIDAINFVLENTAEVQEDGKTQVDEAVVERLRKIATKNKVGEKTFNSIVKNFQSVEAEAVEGKRGYNTHKRKLELLLAAETPNEKKVMKQLDKMRVFHDAEVEYKTTLEKLIAQAEAQFASNEKAREANAAVSEKAVEEIMPVSEVRQKEQKVFVVPTQQGIASAKQLLTYKESNIEGLADGIRLAGSRIEKLGLGVDTGTAEGIVIPTSEDPETQKKRESDEKYLDKHGVTKVILGKKHGKKWDTYKKTGSNNSFINTGTYTADDVVLVNVKDYSDGKKVLDKEAQKEILAAKKAGATIIIEPATQKSGMSKVDNTRLQVQLTKAFNEKEVEYRSLQEERSKFQTKEKAEEANKKAAEAKEKVATEKKAATEDKQKVIFKYVELRSELGLDDALNDAELQGMIKELADTYFKGNEENVQSFLDRQWNEQVEYLSNIYAELLEDNMDEDGETSITEEEKSGYKTADGKIALSSKSIKDAAEKLAFEKVASEVEYKNVLELWKEAYETSKEKGKDFGTKELTELLKKNGIAPGKFMKELVTSTTSTNDLNPEHHAIYTLPSHEVVNDKGDTVVVPTKLSSKPFAGGHKLVLATKKYINLDKIKTTVFNTLNINVMGKDIRRFAKQAVVLISSSIESNLSKEKKGKLEFSPYELALADSPARGLLIENVDGKEQINDNMATILRTALYEYISINSYILSGKFKSKQDISNMHGVDEFKVTKEMMSQLGPKGALKKMLANDLGKSIKKLMGIDGVAELDKEQMDRLFTDMGQVAMMMGISEGLLELSEMPQHDYLQLTGNEEGARNAGDKVTVSFVKIGDKNFDEGGRVDKVKETYAMLEEQLPDISTVRREGQFKPINQRTIESKQERIAKDKAGFKPAKEAQETLKHLMNQGYSINGSLVNYVTDPDNVDMIKQAMGWKDVESDAVKESMTFEGLETQIAQNRDIEKSIEELQILKKEVATRHTGKDGNVDFYGATMYFEWFYSKNGRYMMESNTINPQTDKQLHRFIITPKEHEINYDVEVGKNGEVTFNFNEWTGQDNKDARKKVENMKGQSVTKYMLYAIAQGLGIAVDKKSTDFYEGEITKLLKDTVAGKLMLELDSKKVPVDVNGLRVKLLTKGELVVNGIELEIEHVAHALQTLDLLESLEKGERNITSRISAEFDAVTSGFGIKITQMPIIKNLIRYALKVGIVPRVLRDPAKAKKYFGTTDSGIERESWESFLNEPKHAKLVAHMSDANFNPSMNDILANYIKDSYQTLATKITKLDDKYLMKQIGTEEAERSSVVPNFKAYTNNFKKVSKGASNAVQTWKHLGGLLPQYNEVEGKVSSELRNLFKNPFMVFNYSAAIKSIRASLSSNMTSDVLAHMLTPKGEKLAQTIIDTTVGRSKMTVEDLRKDIREKDASFIKLGKNMNLRGYLETMINLTYGSKVDAALNEEFGPFLEVQEVINKSFKAMFYAYNVELQEAFKKEVEEKGLITKEREAAIIKGLQDKFPAIKGPLSDTEEIASDRIGIYSTKTGNPENSVAAQTWVKGSWAKKHLKNADQHTMKVWHRVKEFDAAVSAGSVVPIHYLDGGFMAKLFNGLAKQYGNTGTTSIHDAIIPPLVLMPESSQMYNEAFMKTTQDYSVVGEIVASLEYINNYVQENPDKFKDKIEHYDKGTKEVTNPTIHKFLSDTLAELVKENATIEAGRKEFNELLNEDGTYVMHMASTSEGVYRYNMSEDVTPAHKELIAMGMSEADAAIVAEELRKECK